MKYFITFILGALLAMTPAALAVTIDGVAESQYGSAIATQAIGTVAGDNNYGNQGIANGSELDAGYGFISNGVLYLVMAGNFNSLPTIDGGTSPNDYLNLFFMTGPGGDHTLGTNYTATYNGRINTMGVGANGTDPGAPGLTFDAGFAANYWIGVNVGLDEPQNPGNTMFVDYQVVCANCPSAFFGSVASTNVPPIVLTNVYFGATVQVALNNSNTAGVDGTACDTNSLGAAQSTGAAAVTTGVELAIPLSVIGSPTGQVVVCAFLTDKYFSTMYNQVLGPVSGTPPYCQSFLGTAGSPATTDLGSYPGQHTFTIPVPACDLILVNPATASFNKTGGVASATAVLAGGCPITATVGTAATNWLSIISSSGLASGNGSLTYSVKTNTSIETRTGQIFLTATASTGISTSIVTVSQTGVALPPLGAIVADGTAESAYSCPVAVQQVGTGFGNATNGSLTNAIGGSELDAAYGIIENDVLFLVFAGNLEGNGNKLDVFLQTGPGGQNTLTNINPNIAGLRRMGYLGAGTNPGLTFDAGFAPNYCIMVNGGGGFGSCYVDFAPLWPIGVGTDLTNGLYLGASTPTNGTLLGGTNPYGIQVAVNNSNTGGVDGVSCTTNGLGAAQSIAAAQVRTGIELAIPLAAIGSPTGAIAVCAFVNSGDQSYLSNQILSPASTNPPATFCRANLAESTLVNFNNLDGQQYFIVGPQLRVTGIAKTGNDLNVTWQTPASTNFAYQLQRSSTLTTAVWSNVGAPTNGTGIVITQTDSNAATNTPALFYRVLQTPLCP